MIILSEDTKNGFKDVFKRQLLYYRTEVLRCSQEEAASALNVIVNDINNFTLN